MAVRVSGLILLMGAMPLACACAAQADVTFTSSNLPIVVIDTHGQRIPDEPKIDAYLGIIDNRAGQRNHRDDPHNDCSGPIAIELLGSIYQNFPKKSYAFETRDAQGANRNVALLGMLATSPTLYVPSWIELVVSAGSRPTLSSCSVKISVAGRSSVSSVPMASRRCTTRAGV